MSSKASVLLGNRRTLLVAESVGSETSLLMLLPQVYRQVTDLAEGISHLATEALAMRRRWGQAQVVLVQAWAPESVRLPILRRR